jgi:hypothetical protein
MKLGGTAFLALWNGVQPEALDDYEAWHSREHVPERLTVPGILAAWRYRDIDEACPGFFTLYDLADIQVLESAPYQRLVSHPSPASARLRPQLTGMTRIVCRIDTSEPGPDGRFIAPRVTGAGVTLATAPEGLRCHAGTIDTNAPGHPLANVRPTPGCVVLLEGDDDQVVRAAACRVADDDRLFTLIEAIAPVSRA